MNTTNSQHGEFHDPRKTGVLGRAPIRFLFGYDVFISYARSDADAYAELLETRLEALGFATFRDKREINAGDRLDSSLKSAIRRSRQFVLLDTPGARQSRWVAGEIETFLQSRRQRLTRIICQGVGHEEVGPWEDQELGKLLESFVWTVDTPEAFASGKPSDEVIEQIRRNFRTVRLRNLMRITVGTVIAGLSGLLILSVRQTIQATRQARIATARELVSASLMNQGSDPELSMVLAMYAVAATWPSGHIVLPEAEERLHVGLFNSREKLAVKHNESVTAVAWSPDGRRLATASDDHTAKVWDAETGRELVVLRGQTNINCVAWSPDGKRLATAGFDNTARLWEAASGELLLTLPGHKANIRSVVWSPDGTELATGSEDHTARVWDAATGVRLITLHGQEDSFTTVVWSPDGHKLATASHENAAKVWDARTGKELFTLRGHEGTVMTIAWSPDGKKLATGALDGITMLWDAFTGDNLLSLINQGCSVSTVSWSLDGSRLASGCSDGIAKVWDVGDIEPESSTKTPAVSPEPDTLSQEHVDGSGMPVGFSQSVPFASNAGKELLVLRGHTASINSVAWSPDGKRLATGSEDHTARVWETGSSRELLTLSGLGTIFAVTVSPDGTRFVTGSYLYDNAAEVWNSSNGGRLLILHGHSAPVSSTAWSPDGQRLATGSKDHTAMLWDASSGTELLTLNGHTQSVESVAWSPDGKRLATGSLDDTGKVWDAKTGKELFTLRGHSYSVDSVAWSPDGKLLATGSADDSTKLWDAQTGKEILTLTGGNGSPNSLAWSPDGSQLAMGSGDALKVWSMPGGKELLARTSDGNLMSVAWSHDGTRFAAGVGSELRVWNARNGQQLLAMPSDGSINSIAWSPNDKRLIGATFNGNVHVYAMDIHDLMTLARQRVTRDLTHDQCRIYLHTDKCPPLPNLSD
jgi:WD40 repeat protein